MHGVWCLGSGGVQPECLFSPRLCAAVIRSHNISSLPIDCTHEERIHEKVVIPTKYAQYMLSPIEYGDDESAATATATPQSRDSY